MIHRAMAIISTAGGSTLFGSAAESLRTRQAGFWQRIFAFTIDSILVAIMCLVLGLAFKNFFSRESALASALAFLIALIYFAWFGRRFGHGQTPGHRFFNLAVVDKDGNLLSLPRSLLRCSILLAPLYLGPAVDATGWRPLGWLLDTAAFAIFYLYIFNRGTKQSLHDLATGSFVIDAPGNGAVSTPPFWRWHWALLGLVLLFFPAADYWMARSTHADAMPELVAIQQALIQSGKVQGVPSVSLQEDKVPPRIIRTLRATIVPTNPPADYDKVATELAGIMIKADPQAIHQDYVVIDFVEGFKVGFATYSSKRFVSHTPEDWLKLIAQASVK